MLAYLARRNCLKFLHPGGGGSRRGARGARPYLKVWIRQCLGGLCKW